MQRHAVTCNACLTACRRMVSGAISLSSSEFFSPSPHGTGSPSVPTVVFIFAGWSWRIRAGFLVSRVTQDNKLCRHELHEGGCHPLARLSRRSRSLMLVQQRGPTTRMCLDTRFALPRSLATTGESLTYFLFLRVLRCFSSPRSPHDIVMMTALRRPGCPIRNPRVRVICT